MHNFSHFQVLEKGDNNWDPFWFCTNIQNVFVQDLRVMAINRSIIMP